MKNVNGIGGVFIKAKDPEALAKWYAENLGIEFADGNYTAFRWLNEKADVPGTTVFSFFEETSDYFDPSESRCMINFRVKDLHALLKTLKQKGVWVSDKTEYYEYGSFGWIMDPEGNKIELWQPNDDPL
jgi:predicted enzyme related to lactoylglutathione lyase